MITFLERVYLAAPCQHPLAEAFNQRLVTLLREYNFPMWCPQEYWQELQSAHPDWSYEQIKAEHDTDRRDVLMRANLVVAVAYGEDLDPHTALECGIAIGRGIDVIVVQNKHLAELAQPLSLTPPANLFCTRTISVPEEEARLCDALIPVMNRFFVSQRTWA